MDTANANDQRLVCPCMSLLRIGAHGESDDPVTAAKARDANAAQFFVGDPQGWKGPRLDYPAGAAALRQAAEKADVALIVHAPYVINVATTNNRIRIPSRKLLQQYVNAAAEVGAKGLVVHGGHVNKGEEPREGIANWVKALQRTDTPIPLLLENTAGGDYAMARHFDRLAQLWEAASNAADQSGAQLGFCLDTCHAHAAGENLSDLVNRLMAITGRLDVVHVNDSRDAFGSGADRHANLGTGHIDPAALFAVVHRAVEVANPILIVETAAAGQAADIAWLRNSLAAGAPLPHAQTAAHPSGVATGQGVLDLE